MVVFVCFIYIAVSDRFILYTRRSRDPSFFFCTRKMLFNVLRQQTRIALAASRLRLPIVSAQASRTRLALLPTFLGPLRTLTTRAEEQNPQAQDESRDAPERFPPSKTVFVGNLPYSIDDQELHDRFSIFGRIVEVRVGA